MLSGLNHITLAVRDIAKSFNFYHDILQLKPICRWDKGAYFLVYSQQSGIPARRARGEHAEHTFCVCEQCERASNNAGNLSAKSIQDFWFCLNADNTAQPTPDYTHYAFSVTQEHFSVLCERIIASGAVVFQENTSPGDSLYFLDPDGHKLEIHVGDWQSRVAAKKLDVGAWKNVVWFV